VIGCDDFIGYDELVALIQAVCESTLPEFQFYDDETPKSFPAVVLQPHDPTVRYITGQMRGEWKFKVSLVGGQISAPRSRDKIRKAIHPTSALIVGLDQMEVPGGYVLPVTASVTKPFKVGSVKRSHAEIVCTLTV
jgi:hypothetical protein